MRLPAYVLRCLETLEQAGFAAYAVGGCVRDQLLGLEPQDFDLCTDARPEQTQALFADRELVLSGLKHGTVGVISGKDVVEITTFRTEGGYSDCRHPDWVRFVDRIEEDLARRDFTVNAMAWSPTRGLKDPFGGREDLEKGILRTVGIARERFREDALRILRGARFAAKYRLEPEKETFEAMVELAPLMEDLARERVFSELCKLLLHADTRDLMRYAPLITQVIPELAPTLGFDQRCQHHAFDLYTHIAHVTGGVPRELPLRWAALLHDLGKLSTFTLDEQGQGHFYGHAQVSARLAGEILHRLKAPTALTEEVVTLISQHMTLTEPQRNLLKRRLSRLGAQQFFRLLDLQEADTTNKGIPEPGRVENFRLLREMTRELLEEQACLSLRDLQVNGRDLMALGFPAGKSLGSCLNRLLDRVLDETLPNEKASLLEAAKIYLNAPEEVTP